MASNNYAGFWLRFVAYLVDYIIIQILQSFIVLPVLAALGFGFAASTGFDWSDLSDQEIFGLVTTVIAAMGTLIILTTAIQILYYAIMEASKYQATLGKMVLGLKVTDMDGKPLDFAKCLLRNVAKIISGMLMLIGYIMAGLTEKKQALHDMIANALVVKK